MEDSSDPLIGQTISQRYLVLSELGSGGFGAVYMGKHVELNSPVALKVLHGHLIRDTQQVTRFKREAEAASKLRHPGIASVFDIGVLDDGRPYMVMEYLSGRSLANVLTEDGPLPYQRLVPLIVDCCDALRYAHRMGLLHRDIKPDNIFITKDIDGREQAKLLDFGLAKVLYGDDLAGSASSLTDTGMVLGTPWYMSPEQCQALPLDGRSDLYSLAYSMYELVTGRRAFKGGTPYQIMHAHLHDAVPPMNRKDEKPVVPDAMEKAIIKALSKSPNDRQMTAEEFKQALLSAMSADTDNSSKGALNTVREASADRPAATPSTRKPKLARSSKSRQNVYVAVAVLTCLIAGGCFVWKALYATPKVSSVSPMSYRTTGTTGDNADVSPVSSAASSEPSTPADSGTGGAAPLPAASSTADDEAARAAQAVAEQKRSEEEARLKELEDKTRDLQQRLQLQAQQEAARAKQQAQLTARQQQSQSQQQTPTAAAVPLPQPGWTTDIAPPQRPALFPPSGSEGEGFGGRAQQQQPYGYGNPSERRPGPPGWMRPPEGALPPGVTPADLPAGWRPGDPLPPGFRLPNR